MVKRKINYHSRWADDGTHFDQEVAITQKDARKVNLFMKKQKVRDPTSRMYMQAPLRRSGNRIYTNLTQRDLFAKALGLKLKKDRNTSFRIL